MFARYSTTIAPIIAVLNGILAASITQFPPNNVKLKLGIILLAILLGLIACGATIYSQSLNIAKEDAEKAKRKLVRETLGAFIGTGSDYLREVTDKSSKFDPQPVEQWAVDVEAFLVEHMGKEYLSRFRDYAGLTPLYLAGADDVKQTYWRGLSMRMIRLHEFSREYAS